MNDLVFNSHYRSLCPEIACRGKDIETARVPSYCSSPSVNNGDGER